MAKRRMNPFAHRREAIGTSIVASARRIDLKSRDDVKQWVKKPQEWQQSVWSHFDLNGQIKYGITFKANVCSKVRLYVGRFDPDNPTDTPERIEDGPAIEALDLLRDGLGSHGELLRRAAVNIEVAGEFYVIGLEERIATRPVDPANLLGPTEEYVEVEESWGLYSTEELKVGTDGKLKLRLSGEVGRGKKEIELDPENDYVLRVWFPHPRFADQPDSPMRGVLGDAEDIHDLRQMMRACDNSRMGAGVFIMPTEETRGLPDPTNVPTEAGDERQDPVMKLIEDIMLDAVEKSDSPSRVAPAVLRVGKDNVANVKWIDLGRKVTPEDLERLRLLNESLEQGINLPVGTISGVKDVNHWGAWQIDEATFTGHVEPLLLVMCSSLTTGYLRPYLTAEDGPNMDEEEASNLVIWYDATLVVKDPDPRKTATDAFDKNAISYEAYRRVLGIDEDDAPTDEELAMRIGVQRGGLENAAVLWFLQQLDPNLKPSPDATDTTALPSGNGQQPADTTDGDQGPPPEDQPAEQAPPEQNAVTAAAPRRARRDLGARLHSIDQGLRIKLQSSWDQAMQRALDRAAAKALSKTPNAVRKAMGLNSIDKRHVVRVLGADKLREFGVDEDQLLEGAFDSLEPQFRDYTRRAQEASVNLVPRLSGHARAAALAQMARDLDRAWERGRTALLELAKKRLYDPDPAVPELGEYDAGVLIPFGTVREVVSIAGGATESGAWAGIGNGPTVGGLLGDQGVKRKGFQWDYGDFPRTNGFEPHADLDGVEFDNFDDDALANNESWPDVAYFMPGDHDGCVCDAVQILEDEMALAASLAATTA